MLMQVECGEMRLLAVLLCRGELLKFYDVHVVLNGLYHHKLQGVRSGDLRGRDTWQRTCRELQLLWALVYCVQFILNLADNHNRQRVRSGDLGGVWSRLTPTCKKHVTHLPPHAHAM